MYEQDHEGSQFIQHLPCEECGSSDANSLYDDGHQFCFNCRHHIAGEDQPETQSTTTDDASVCNLLEGIIKGLPKRGIDEKTCQKYGYRIAKMYDQYVQAADYRDSKGDRVAQHIRYVDKDFGWTGNAAKAVLWGQHLWPSGGKRLVITEGEIDCMTVAQAFNLRWPVVSLPNGAAGGLKACKRSLEYLESFSEVVLAFDDDEAGHAAIAEVAPLLTPGKCKVAKYRGFKDANELAQAGRAKEVAYCIFEAEVWRPDGIVSGTDLWNTVNEKPTRGMDILYPKLSEMLYGFDKGNLYLFTAGAGIGKSTCVWEIAVDLAQKHNQKIGVMALEDPLRKAALRAMSIYLNKPLNLEWEEDEAKRAEAFKATVGNGGWYFYNHFGSTDIDNLLNKIRYLAVGLGCDWLLLDHISIVVSGLDEGTIGESERKTIDKLMTKLRTLISETGIGVLAVVHLKRVSGQKKSFNEGGKVTLTDLRGSAALEQLPDVVIALERDQQDEEAKHFSDIRILKSRWVGDTGLADRLQYNPTTGRLLPTDGTPLFAPVDEGPDWSVSTDF